MRWMMMTLVAGLSWAAAAQAPQPTMQQQFDAAQKAEEAGDLPAARQAYQALQARFPAGSKNRARFLVEARLGAVLVAMEEPERAEPLLRSAITGFSGDSPADREERAVAALDLGRALEMQGRLGEASEHYRMVVTSAVYPADSPGDVRARVALGRTLIWRDPVQARVVLDALLTLPVEALGGKDSLALLKALRGRVDLNDNKPREALRWIGEGATAAGGATTRKVSVADVRIRGDLAIANHLLGRQEDVLKAIAYSGAGGLADEGLTRAARVSLPDCAPLGRVAPDAMAIVEFAIADDGRTVGITPIYASAGTGGASAAVVAEEFSNAVGGWVWNSEDAAKLDPFWRQAVRVELRCFTESPVGDTAMQTVNRAASRQWTDDLGLLPFPDTDPNPARALQRLRQLLAEREAEYGPDSAQLAGILNSIGDNVTAPRTERVAAYERHMAILEKENAPAGLRAITGLQLAAMTSDTRRKERDAVTALHDQLAMEGTSEGLMLVKVRLGRLHEMVRAFAQAQPLYDAVIAAPEALLPAAHPVRTEALLRRSNLAMRQQDAATASDALAATGLTPDQCATVDVQPLPENARVTEEDFPNLARRWGTSGFSRVGFDILPDGRTTNVRTVVSSPPFAFSQATADATKRFRYQPTFRPGGTLGCAGSVRNFNFRLVVRSPPDYPRRPG